MILTSLAMMAAMSEHRFDKPNPRIEFEKPETPKNKKNPIQHKGQFEYWFRENGTFLNEKQGERMRKDECVFKCFSINDKNAIRKFQQFNKNQP